MKQLVLHLTLMSRYKTKIMIVAPSVTVTAARLNDSKGTGCVIKDGMHNNAGWEVVESFESVKLMIDRQINNY